MFLPLSAIFQLHGGRPVYNYDFCVISTIFWPLYYAIRPHMLFLCQQVAKLKRMAVSTFDSNGRQPNITESLLFMHFILIVCPCSLQTLGDLVTCDRKLMGAYSVI